jgi:putative transposase
MGRQPHLVGGGLVRSAGGWSEIKALRRIGEDQKGDERILGSGAFVASMISEAELLLKYRLANLDREKMALALLTKCCRKNNVSIEALRGGSRLRKVSRIRRELVYRLTDDLGLSLAETAKLLGVSTSAVAKAMTRKK